MGSEIGDLQTRARNDTDSPAMILTCPECATRYFVDDARVGPNGREVRCASCGNRWMAKLQAQPLELDSTPEVGAMGDDHGKPGFKADTGAVAASDLPAEELPKAFRARAQTRAKEREAAATGVVWAGLAGGFAVLIGAAVFLRQDISQIFPRAAGAYAMAGLPVNLVGLTIENQHAQPMLKDGHAALTITGALRNIRGKPVVAPPLRISLLAPGGRVVATQIADPDGARIPPGAARHFSVDILDPPVSATNVEIAFVLKPRPDLASPAQPGKPAPPPMLRARAGPGPHHHRRAGRPGAARRGRSVREVACPPGSRTPNPCPRPRPTPCRATPPMAERGPAPTEILSEARVAEIVESMADAIAPRIDDETVFVCMLTGGIWFSADLSRALARRGRNPLFDSLWVSSYADGRTTTGVVQIRAGLQRPVQGQARYCWWTMWWRAACRWRNRPGSCANPAPARCSPPFSPASP